MAHLHAVEEEVRHFIDRDFLTLLLQGRSMATIPLALGEVVPGAKRFLVEIIRPGRGGPGLWLSFEEHSGWLVAGVLDPGWLVDLPPSGRDALAAALAGLYKMAGVDLVREPIARALGPDAPSYDFREEGLVVWPDDASTVEILYLLRPEPGVPPLVDDRRRVGKPVDRLAASGSTPRGSCSRGPTSPGTAGSRSGTATGSARTSPGEPGRRAPALARGLAIERLGGERRPESGPKRPRFHERAGAKRSPGD